MQCNIELILKRNSFALKSCGGSKAGRSTPVINTVTISDGVGRSSLALVLTFGCQYNPLAKEPEGTWDNLTGPVTTGSCYPDEADSRTTAAGVFLDGV
jgi:hypothetical protein